MAIPLQFTESGVLAPGDYTATLAEIRASVLVSGAGVASSHWDANWRAECIGNNYPCGMPIESSFGLIMGSPLELKTRGEIL